MRFTLAGFALFALAGSAAAEDNPACAKFKNDYEYNACLARLGPKAAAVHGSAAPLARDGFVALSRTKRGRMQAVFDLTPRKK